jgi:hypothetical protein
MKHHTAFQIANVKMIFRPSEAPIVQEQGRSKVESAEAALNKQISWDRAPILVDHEHRHRSSAITAQRS